MTVSSGLLRAKSRRSKVVAAQKVILQVPKPLLVEADDLAVQLQTNRSDVIRVALKEKIESHKQARLKAELKEGYLAMARQRSRDHEDFEAITSEMLSDERRLVD